MGQDPRVPPRPGELQWFTSTWSTNPDTACVEAAWRGGTLLLRDSRTPSGPVLRIPAAVWQAFVDGVQQDEFS